MKVNLHYFSDRRKGYQFDVYRRCSAAFKQKDIDLSFHPNELPRKENSGDCIIVQHYMATPAMLGDLNRPVIIEESEDCSTPQARDALALRNVVTSYKISVAKALYINCQTKSLCAWMLSKTDNYYQKHLSDYEISKIRPGIHFGMFNRMMPWIESSPSINLDDWSHRPTDVMFAGRVDAYISEINGHRNLFYDELKSIKKLNVICECRRIYSKNKYRELSRNAKIVVSPWGHGELCYRDFEAMLDGCILIKPNTDFIRVLDNILQAGKTYIPCSYDATDLEEIIHFVLKNPESFDEMRSRNRQMALDCFSPDYIATWWKNQFANFSI